MQGASNHWRVVFASIGLLLQKNGSTVVSATSFDGTLVVTANAGNIIVYNNVTPLINHTDVTYQAETNGQFVVGTSFNGMFKDVVIDEF